MEWIAVGPEGLVAVIAAVIRPAERSFWWELSMGGAGCVPRLSYSAQGWDFVFEVGSYAQLRSPHTVPAHMAC